MHLKNCSVTYSLKKNCFILAGDTPLQTNQHTIQDTPKKANKQSNKGIGQGQQKLHSPGQVPLPSDLSLKSGKEMPGKLFTVIKVFSESHFSVLTMALIFQLNLNVTNSE